MSGYAIAFERTATGFSAYSPDLPGLGVAGSTYEKTEQLMCEGIRFHLEDLCVDSEPILEPVVQGTRMLTSA